jgi:histidinol-phosphate/aromatic aminotransferase/cobyric acid decarboxylase-like protein
VVVIDESFMDFADENESQSILGEAGEWENLIVLKSLGKNFGLHGVRMGYAVASIENAERLRRALPPWNVNGLAEALISTMPAHLADYELSRKRVVRDRIALESALRAIPGLRVYPSRANFVYFRIPAPLDGIAVRNRLLCEHGCFVRECGNKQGSDSSHFRVATRRSEETAVLLSALTETLSSLA